MLFGPIADAASEKLKAELPDEFVIASEFMSVSAIPSIMGLSH